jgi:hypothetical protein
MERTVECLLSMDGAGAGAPGVASPSASPPAPAPAPAPAPVHSAQIDPAVRFAPSGSYLPANFNAAPATSSASGGKSASSSLSSFGARALDVFDELPNDFLRPPSFFVHGSQAARLKISGASNSQEEQDRILALLLQDQMFMEGLRQNPGLLDDARAADAERRHVDAVQRREAQNTRARLVQMNARELHNDQVERRSMQAPAGSSHGSSSSSSSSMLPAQIGANSRLASAQPAAALPQVVRGASIPRPSAGMYGAVPGDENADVDDDEDDEQRLRGGRVNGASDDRDPDEPIERELTFGEKLSLLGDAAKAKLKSFFSSDSDGSKSGGSSAASSSTYRNLPSIDDEASGGSIMHAGAEQEMSEFSSSSSSMRANHNSSALYSLDDDDSYLHDDAEPVESTVGNGKNAHKSPMLMPRH